jgi:uncharacterized membrane protein
MIESMQKRTSAREQREKRRKERNQAKTYSVDSGIQDTMAGDLTSSQIFEGRVIIVLLSVFALCILEGLVLAASVRFSIWLSTWALYALCFNWALHVHGFAISL